MGDADTGNDHLSDVDLPSQSALASLAEQPGDAAAKPRPKPPSFRKEKPQTPYHLCAHGPSKAAHEHRDVMKGTIQPSILPFPM